MSSDDEQLSIEQKQFCDQLSLEEQLRSLTNYDEKREAVKGYLDHVLNGDVIKVNDFGKDLNWINVTNSLSLHNDLQGLIVVLDFFTYCCINCMHILPNLHKLENRFRIKDGLIIVGVHSPKFYNEKDLSNVSDAVLRYEIEHPIVNDPNGIVWSQLDIHCWPTVLILGPNSELLFTVMGENGVSDFLELYCHTVIEYFEKKKVIDLNKKVPIKLLRESTPTDNVLHFPGKISASPDDNMLAISDSEHHRIIISTITGVILYLIGGNDRGFENGSFADARFHSPQGIAWKDNETLYIADTLNHAIRELDLCNKKVITIAGDGTQGDDRIGGNIGREQKLNSPWDLLVADDKLFIAMAGSHQIWVFCLNNIQIFNKSLPRGCCTAIAGSGAEENRNNKYPHRAGFAQPSGLAYDTTQKVLYIADSESSSIRSINTITGDVRGIVGGDRDPRNLFSFGDRDGIGIEAKLQHPLGVAFCNETQSLFIADTYNHKVKEVHIISKECISISGTGISGNTSNSSLLETQMNEPCGLCITGGGSIIFVTDTNNHSIKRLDLVNDNVRELNLVHVFDTHDIEGVYKDIADDHRVDLEKIKINELNNLRIKTDFKFLGQLKPSDGAKQCLELVVPDNPLFLVQKENLIINDFNNPPEFSVSIGELQNENDALNFTLITYAKLSLCNLNENICKQIKLAFYIPIEIVSKNNSDFINEKVINLPFNFD